MSPGEQDLRARIVAALLAVVARDGFEGATFRRVAAAAGCSAGAVQKRFASRDELLAAGLEAVAGRVEQRTTDAEASLEEAVRETLPLDERRRVDALVWSSYVVRAAIEPHLAHRLLALDAGAERTLTTALDAGGTPAPELVAPAILALVDGFAERLLRAPAQEHARLLQSLDAALATLIAGRRAER